MDWKSVNFDWNRARAFLVTAEEGSLSTAARALGMAQPTLGRQVAALERAIAQLCDAGHLPADYGKYHLTLTRVLVAARLLAPDSKPPANSAQLVLAQASGCDDYSDLLHMITKARHGIALQWAKTFGEKLELD